MTSLPLDPTPDPIAPVPILPPSSSEPPAANEPVVAVRPLVPMREIADPLQPIDILSQALSGDPWPSGKFTAAVIELRTLLDKQKALKAAQNASTTASQQSPASPSPDEPPTVCLADVPQRGVEWLWPDRIPLGKITLLVGDPGVGKSLIALDVAARVTTGAPWPDDLRQGDTEKGRQGDSPAAPGSNSDPSLSPCLPHSLSNTPRSVLLLSAEDDLADTVRPRLEALDADCSRVIALTSSRTTQQSPCIAGPSPTPCPPPPAPCSFDLSRDVALLDRLLDSHPDCALVIIDPISAYLGRAVENVNAEVRRIMAPLAELAERRRLAVLVVSHLRKQAGSAIHRSIGSLAFVAAARTAWLVTKESKTEVDYTPERRLLLPIKNNIATDTNGLACSIESHPHAGLPIVQWSTEPLDMDADEALMAAKPSAGRPAQDRDEAARWLQSQLTDGPRPSAEVEESAIAHGFSVDTLRRAFRHLGGAAVRTGFGSQGKWHWQLPSIDRQNPRPNSAHLCTDPQKNHTRPVC